MKLDLQKGARTSFSKDISYSQGSDDCSGICLWSIEKNWEDLKAACFSAVLLSETATLFQLFIFALIDKDLATFGKYLPSSLQRRELNTAFS